MKFTKVLILVDQNILKGDLKIHHICPYLPYYKKKFSIDIDEETFNFRKSFDINRRIEFYICIKDFNLLNSNITSSYFDFIITDKENMHFNIINPWKKFGKNLYNQPNLLERYVTYGLKKK